MALFLMMVGAVAVVLHSAGCTKKKELQNKVDPDAYIAKSDLVGKTFSLVRGIEEAESHNPMEAVPGESIDFGLVEARILETELQFVQVFDPQNRKETATILASFPITNQFDIKREENDFKEQTNKIVEDKSLPWEKRQFIRVDWSKPSNAMSKFTRFVGGEGVDQENTILLETPKVEDGHISWLVETALVAKNVSYKRIAWDDWQPETSYRVVYRTHLMPLKPSDFQPIEYGPKDFERFGYFLTQQNFEDPVRGLRDSQIKSYAQVFNVCEPGRKNSAGTSASCSTNKIVWNLNKGFNERFLRTARQAVAQWNQVFQKALGRTDDVVVLDESKQVDPVDPRYNIIHSYAPKTETGPCGVAQFVSNPRTGETISARANMFEDCIRGISAQADDLIDLILADPSLATVMAGPSDLWRSTGQRNGVGAKSAAASVAKSSLLKLNQLNPSLLKQMEMQQKALGMDVITTGQSSVKDPVAIAKNAFGTFKENAGKVAARKVELMKQAPDLFVFDAVSDLGGLLLPGRGLLTAQSESGGRTKDDKFSEKMGGMEHLMLPGEQIRAEKNLLLQDTQRGVHRADFVEPAALNYLLKIIQSTDVKELDAKREQIKAELEERAFFMILLHEMGHTFGLRHNFEGSVDKEHFHPEYFRLQELVKAGQASPDELDPYQFSSVMDYMSEFYVWTGGLSQYDNAAIKYAYNRAINRDTDPVALAGFRFCTDHQVGEDALCNRFDKGTNLSEITLNRITAYERSYIRSHFRRDRAQFEAAARGYPWGLMTRTMLPIRQVMDELLYSFANPDVEKVPRQARANGRCDLKFMRESVDRGEIVNICDPVAAEAAGVNLNDLSTLWKGLFNSKSGDFLRIPSDYKPLGLADFLYANLLAQRFFMTVIGATEPGLYVATPPSGGVQALQAGAPFTLTSLEGEGSEEERIAAFEASNQKIKSGLGELNRTVKGSLVDLRIGPGVMYGSTEFKTVGLSQRLARLGSIVDKMVAIQALGVRDVGVMKYDRIGMMGNAYAYPQSKKFVTTLFRALTTENPWISVMQVPLRDDDKTVIPVVTNASLDKNVQLFSTIISLTDFVLDGDKSMLDKFRICSVNEQGCLAPTAADMSVEFKTASGQDRFRAVQTPEGDSSAFRLVSQAKELDQERSKWSEILTKSGGEQAENLMKLDQARAELRPRLESSLAKFPALGFLSENVLRDDASNPGAWLRLEQFTRELLNKGPAESEQIAVSILTDFHRLEGGLAKLMADMGEKGVCKEPSDSECQASPDVVRRKALTALVIDFTQANQLAQTVALANFNARVAPGVVQSLTNQLASQEADIRLIRKIMRLTAED